MTDTNQQSPVAASAAAGPPPDTTRGPGGPSSAAPQRSPRPGPPRGDHPNRPSRAAAPEPKQFGKAQMAVAGVAVALLAIGAVQAGVPIGAVIAVVIIGAVIAGIVYLIRRAKTKRAAARAAATGRGGNRGNGGGKGSGPRGSGGPGGRPSLRDRLAARVPGMKPSGTNPNGKGPGGRSPAGTGPKGGGDRKGLARFLNRKNKDKPGTDQAARSGGLPPNKPGDKKSRNPFRRGDKPGAGTAPRGKRPGAGTAPGGTDRSRNPFRRNKNGSAGTTPFKNPNKPGAGTGTSANLVSRATQASWKQWRTNRHKAKAERIKSGNTRPRVAWRATKKGTAAGLIGAATVAGWGWRGSKATGRAAGRSRDRVASWWARKHATSTGPTVNGSFSTGANTSTQSPPSSPPRSGALGLGSGTSTPGNGAGAVPPSSSSGGARYPQTAHTPTPPAPPKPTTVFTAAPTQAPSTAAKVPSFRSLGPAIANQAAARAAASATPTKGTSMSHHATQGTVEAASQMASYQPKNLLDIVNMSHSAPGAIASLSQAFNNLASGLEGTPAAASADAYRQIAAQLTASASSAAEAGAMLETAHTADLNRIRNPRPNEAMADFSQNQS